MNELVWLAAFLVLGSFLLIVFRGAPFVPTRRQDVGQLFAVHEFKPGEVFVDLGSGDGRMLAAAARRDISSVGYELNPFLVALSRFRVKGLSPQPVVKLEDFWFSSLPEGTAVVFVFLAGPFMKKLDAKLSREASRLDKTIMLVSYGVPIPDKQLIKQQGGYLVYEYAPGAAV